MKANGMVVVVLSLALSCVSAYANAAGADAGVEKAAKKMVLLDNNSGGPAGAETGMRNTRSR